MILRFVGKDHVACSKIRSIRGRDANYEHGHSTSPAICGRLDFRMNSLYDRMSQLMTMFQKQKGQSIYNNTKNNPWRVRKEHVKACLVIKEDT